MLGHRFVQAGASMLFLTLHTVKTRTQKVTLHIEHDVVTFQLAVDGSCCMQETH